LTERSTTSEERRRQILAGAVRAFAGKGFHAARVGDIASEAGVAHGLLYHYFDSKEEVLRTVFSETWAALLEAVKTDVEESGTDAREQIRRLAAIVLRTWGRDPDLVRVLVREVTRTPQLLNEIDEVGQALAAIERIVAGGQERGELRASVSPRLAAIVVYGALEEILTAWVLGQLPDGEEDIARAEQVVVEIVCDGIAAPVAAPLV
jgi:TetR/AcrR family transcriptional regulator, fatty acid metabolism regulator protein